MNLNNDIIKVISGNLTKNSDYEFITDLEDLTLLDVFALIKGVKTRDEHHIYNKNYIK